MPVVRKFEWKKFCNKLWKQGVYTALKEEACPVIPSQFDEMGLEVLDKLVGTFLAEETEEE